MINNFQIVNQSTAGANVFTAPVPWDSYANPSEVSLLCKIDEGLSKHVLSMQNRNGDLFYLRIYSSFLSLAISIANKEYQT